MSMNQIKHSDRTIKKGLGRRLLSALLTLCMVASLALGTGIASEAPAARAAETWLPNTYSDSNTHIIWRYETNGTEARKLYAHSFFQDTTFQTIPTTISLPSIPNADSSSPLTITSIGNPDVVSGTDSFFTSEATTGYLPTSGITIDASGCTSLTQVNNYAFKGRSSITLNLPKTITSVGVGVLGGGANNAIKCDALNATYNNKDDIDSATFSFTGFSNSSAKEAFSEKIGDRFTETSDTRGSYKYVIDTDSMNADTEDPAVLPTSTRLFSKYVYKTDFSPSMNQLDSNAIPTRTYNNFLGYFYDKDASTSIKIFNANGTYAYPESGETTDITEPSVHLTAHWDEKDVTITFNGNGATDGDMASITVKYGKEYERPVDPQSSSTTPVKKLPKNVFTRTGYTFNGWKSQDGTTYTDEQANVSFKKNTTLTAQWTENEYTVTFDANYPTNASIKGGSMNPNPHIYRYTQGLTTLPNCGFTAGGYVFAGWTTNKSVTPMPIINWVNEAIAATDSQKKVTLYATWVSEEYTVEFYDRGNPLPELPSKTYKCNEAPGALPVPATPYTGHTFLGWARSATGTLDYPKGTNVTGDITTPTDSPVTLYARYDANSYTIKYEKNDGDEGTDMLDEACFYDQDIQIRNCTYTHTGCEFVGWSTSKQPILSVNTPDSNIQNITLFNNIGKTFPQTARNVIANGSITLYPVWRLKQYHITYNGIPSDATIKSGTKTESYIYGETITLPELTRPNYTFKGWLDEQGNTVTNNTITGSSGNRTFTAKWNSDYIVKISGSDILNVTAGTKTLVKNGTITGETFKNGASISNIKIKAYENQLITQVTISDDGSTTPRVDRSYASPANEITLNDSVTFNSRDLVIAITIKPVEFKITYNTDGGTITGTAPTKYTYGTETKLPTSVTKTDGSKFYGWKNSAGQIVTTISKTQTGDLTFTAVWEDPNVVGLPEGTLLTPSLNGRFLTIQYANKKTEEVNLYANGIHLIKGSNIIQFKLADTKTYLATVDFSPATEMPSTMKTSITEDGAYAIITYKDNVTQQVVINKYNSEVSAAGTRIYFEALDGNRYTTILGSSTEPVDPSPSPSPDPEEEKGKPQPDEYYMISNISYNVRNSKATVTNPSDWDAKTLTIKPTITLYGKKYKVTKIAADSFNSMPKLTKVTIGKYVTSIGARAFAYCRKLKTILFNSGNVTSMGKNALKKIAKNATITIKASKKKYKKLVKLIKKKGGIPKSTKFKRIT